MADALASLCLCPTSLAQVAIVPCDPYEASGFEPLSHVVGQTGLDAARMVVERLGPQPPSGRCGVLVTMHRHENRTPEKFRAVACAVARAAGRYAAPWLYWRWYVHGNPAVRALLPDSLALSRVEVCEPADYETMISQLRSARLVITDSGGLQEECAYFKVPCLVLRDVTERVEAVQNGCSRLVGCDPEHIESGIADALEGRWGEIGPCPYGDGHAAEQVCRILEEKYA